jgi:hypothetical protein
MFRQLLALTGWSFVGASACVFVAVAALVHGAFDLIERKRQAPGATLMSSDKQ